MEDIDCLSSCLYDNDDTMTKQLKQTLGESHLILYKGIIKYNQTSEGANSKQK